MKNTSKYLFHFGILAVCLFSCVKLFGQNTFQRLDDFENGAITKHFEIWEANNRIYLGGIQFQNFKHPGTYIAEYTLEGDLLNFASLISKDYSNIVWDYSAQLNDSIIYRVGYGHSLGENNSKIFLYKCQNFNTIKRIAEFESLYFNDSIDASKQQISIGGICLSGEYIYFALSEIVPKSIGLNALRIIKTDTTGKLIWQKEIISTTTCIEAQRAISDGTGGIYLSSVWYETCNSDVKIEKRMGAHIMHFSQDGDLLSHIQTPEDKSKYFIQQIDSLWWGASDFIIDSNAFVLATAQAVELYMPNRRERLPAIVNLTSSGKINWSIAFDNQRDVTSTFQRIIKTKKSDGYVAVGYATDTTNGFLSSSGIISKISLDGKEKWRRYYSHWNKEGPTSLFYDVSESSDGGFYIVGEAVDSISSNNFNVKGWFLKVDSMGCLVPGCQITNATDEIPSLSTGILLYPNPVKDGQVSLYVGAESPLGRMNVTLINVSGQIVKSWELDHLGPTTFMFEISECPPGIYPIRIEVGDRIWTKKLIVQ